MSLFSRKPRLKLPYISLEVTSACNLNCLYCYNPWKATGKMVANKETYGNWIRTIKRLMSMAEVGHVTFTGGEPLLFDRILELVLFVRMRKMGVTFISNGSHENVDDYKRLIDLGVGVFEFPLHSANANVHDQMTRVSGSWERSLNSIKAIKALGGYVVPVIVLSRINMRCIADTIAFIHGLGIETVMIARFNIGGNGVKERDLLQMTHEELKQAFAIINELSVKYAMDISSNVCSPVCVLNPKEYPNIGFGHCGTDVLQKPITMDINGNIRLCNHSPVNAGNIFTSDIKDILDSPYARSWNSIVPHVCKDCKDWDVCLGGCRAAAEQIGLCLHYPDPILISQQDGIPCRECSAAQYQGHF